MRFKPGQQVVCICDKGWKAVNHDKSIRGPKRDDLVTIDHYNPQDNSFIILVEFKYCQQTGRLQSFDENSFAPLMDISELTAILEQQPEHA